MRAYQHSCGGYYTAREREDGSHHQPAHCVVFGWGECYDSPEIALDVARGHLTGDHPGGGDPVEEDYYYYYYYPEEED